MRTWLAVAAMLLAMSAAAGEAAETAGSKLPAGLELLRRTERAFAKATAEIGIRNGFLTFFAPDAISPPDTGSAWARIASRPAYVEPPDQRLLWEPLYGDVAQSVDVGYLTGPSTFTLPDGTQHHGIYFSVWRRSPEGLWRVVFDAGVDLPSPAPEFSSGVFRAAPASGWTPPAGAATGRDDLREVERDFAAAARNGVRAAYERHLDPHARMHRDGAHPWLGRDAILGNVSAGTRLSDVREVKTDVAAAGDLGWVFGTVVETVDGRAVPGTFLRVWRRDDQGRWRIVVDLAKANPAPK